MRVSEMFVQSARQARRDETWPAFDAEMRACSTLTDLEAAWKRWHPVIRAYPARWQECAVDLHEECKEALGGTLEALKQSVERLEEDGPGRLYEAWQEDKRRW